MSAMPPSFARGASSLQPPAAQARASAKFAQNSVRRSCIPESKASYSGRGDDASLPSAGVPPHQSSESDFGAPSANHVAIWHEYADHLDAQQHRLEVLRESRDSAAAEEDFFAAAAFAQQAEDLEGSDSLKRLRRAQADAIAIEDFEKAAQIHQARLGALCGWWHVSPGQADAWGHVLHVSESFGKLTGTAYSAADLVKVFGCTPDNQMRAKLNPELLGSVGATIFEVCITALQGSALDVQQQAFFLRDNVPASGHVRNSILANLSPGHAPPQPSPAALRSRSRLRSPGPPGLSPPGGDPPLAPRRCSTPDSGTRRRSLTPRRRPAGRATAHRRPYITPRSRRRSHSAPPPSTPGLDSARAALERSLALPLPAAGDPSPAAACVSVDDEAGGDVALEDDPPPPAVQPDPVLTPLDPDSSVTASNDAAPAVERSSDAGVLGPSALSADAVVDAPVVSRRGASRESAVARRAGAPESGATSLRDAGAPASGGGAAAGSSERSGPAERTPARIALDRDGATLIVQLPPADAHMAGGGPQVTYRRMDTGGGGSDRLEGYFLGSYGSHGDELLYLQRGLWQGREAIIAHKITGDLYVPAGQVSFRVHTDAPNMRAMYSAMLGADVALAGEGCSWANGAVPAADGGGTSWLPGDLVQLGVQKAPMLEEIAGGAELGFVWTGACHRQFLILLTRLAFDSGVATA